MNTHSQRLERWLGTEAVERLSSAMRGWYGPPIAVAGVPGNVRVCGDGDFVGPIREGAFCSAVDRFASMTRRLARKVRRGVREMYSTAGALASLDQIINAASSGQRFDFQFAKTGTTGVVNATNTLWFVGSMPAAGAAAAAAPGGTVPTDATTGSFPFTNPSSGTQHFITGEPLSSVAANTLFLYDRIFSVTKTMNSTATEAVTGVPTRYQATSGADDAAGNFLMIECRTVLPATAHNWTTCTYTDQDGNTGATLPSVTGNSSNIVNRLDQPAGSWFCPLASGDTGIKALTQMQCSAAVATGAIDFTIGHPLVMLPCPVANMVCIRDGINSAMNLVRIFDDACMALLEINKPATTATTYAGQFMTVWN